MNRSNIIVFAVIFLITCLMFFKIFLRGLFPIPGDLLVSFYFPWYSGGWEGYDSFTTRKELLSADAIRQIYLWKEFASEQFKQGQFPLWNPYTFSGQPLAANFQSSVYYPFNIFYFLTDAKNAWILLITIQPFLGGAFMYLAARSFRISQIASLFSATTLVFSSYFITWLENGNITQTYLWLPLTIWTINKYFEKRKFRYIFILIISLSFAILAGHPQTIIYIIIASFLFWLYKVWKSKKNYVKRISIYVISLLFSLLLTAIQLVPTAEFYSQSPISLPFASEQFTKSILPYKNLVTFFAVDIFGHPASENFWSQSYGDFTPYIGILPLIFSIWSIITLYRKNNFVKFASFIVVLFIIASVRSPITWLIAIFRIPLLDSATPARFISISIFFLALLSGLGFDEFLKNFRNKDFTKRFFIFLFSIGAVYILLWTVTIIGQYIFKPAETWNMNLSVTRRNLVIPTSIFLSLPIGILAINFLSSRYKLIKSWSKRLIIVGIFAVTLYGGLFFSNKFLPMAPKKFIFPEHPLFDWLKANAGINRFYGQGTANVDFNMPIHYEVFTPQGYDTLRFKRYAELIVASKNNGKVPSTYLRSDAVFPDEENGYRKRLFDLLGVKYLLDKEDTPKTGADWNVGKFPNDDVQGYWQDGKFLVYKRLDVLPRAFLSASYQVIKNDDQIIQKIYDPKFNLKTVILEKEPSIFLDQSNTEIIEPKIIKFEPNEVIFETDADYNALLFLSDAYDDDWQVFVDSQRSELLRAHYALRAVPVPQGKHKVIFQYRLISHTLGLYATGGSLLLLLFLIFASVKRKKF